VLVQRYDAPLVLVGLILLAGLSTLVLRPEWATIVTVFLLYVNFPAILTKQHGLPHIFAGSFMLLLSIPLSYFLIIRRERLRADTTFHLMLLLLGVFLVSALTAAVDKTIALGAVQEYVFEGVLLYWLIFNTVRSLQAVRRVIWTVLLAGAFMSSLCLYQTATSSYDQEFGGLAYRRYEAPQGDVERTEAARRRTWDRAQGPLGEPNRFAQILIVLLPLAVYMQRTGQSRRARLSARCLGVLTVTGVVLTLSRGALVGLTLLGAMLVALKWLRPFRAAVLVIVLAMSAPAVPFFADRMSTITELTSLVADNSPAASRNVDSAALGRATLMLTALRVFADHPVVGVGPGQFAPFYSQAYSRDPGIKLRDMPPGAWQAHSLYLGLGAETGVLGLAAFIAIAGVLLRQLWGARRRWLRQQRELSDLSTAFVISIGSYHVTGLFLHLSYQPYYWFLLALAGAAAHLLRSFNSPRTPSQEAHGAAVTRTSPYLS
jgi:hypothetical protein